MKVQIGELMSRSGVRFGTSGARGLVEDMTAEVCSAYLLAFLQVVEAAPGSRVALGMDLRPSSPAIAAACAAAIRHAGLIVDFCGILPTPALAFHARQAGIPAIMVTGSHIPYDRNGIKFYRATGEISKADEQAIAAATVALPEPNTAPALPPVNPAARQAYVRRYVDFFPAGCLAGMRLGFYQHTSVARDLLGEIVHALGAEVTPLGRTDAFVPIDTEAVGEEDVRRGRDWATEYRLDALFSTDGDADRPLLGDEQGTWLRGDIVGTLCARSLGATAVVAPVSCNTVLEKCGVFGMVKRTRIGSPYVIEGIEQAIAAGERCVAGFEANGGFMLGSRIERAGRVLEALPTRDAVLPILTLLAMARETDCPVSALAGELPPRFTASDRLQSFPTETSRALLAWLAKSPEAIAAFFDQSVTALVAIDQTDGLRLTFASGEIVHLRPSGNAPELRCYAEADTPERANTLVKDCLSMIKTPLSGH